MASRSTNHVFTFDDQAVVRRARREISAADPKMGHIVRAVGPFQPGLVKDTFAALVFSIVHQQLSMKAARTIRERLLKLCPSGRLKPEAVMALSEEQIRGAGISRQKVSYIRSISENFLDGAINPRQLRRLPDEQVIEKLIDIKGVGVWTAEMILMFNLRRADVWPIDDLGLRNALRRWYRIPATAKRERLIRAGEKFRPYRSVATWYLWGSLNTGVVPGFRA